jgi:predicted GH43/DUF377 family glycosyl hydrolase
MKRTILLEPTSNEWESLAVLNSTAIKEKDLIHLFYRAVKSPNYSTLGYAVMKNGKLQRFSRPLLMPEFEYEIEGIEDPRIVKIKDKFYLLYTAWDGRNARIALAVSKDMKNWQKKGIISPSIALREAIRITKSKRYKKLWSEELRKRDNDLDLFVFDKDAILFPEKINGKFVLLHRLASDIQIVFFDSFDQLQTKEFWYNYIENIDDFVLMKPKFDWEKSKIGAGATPIKTRQGWLLLYHGVNLKNGRQYNAGAALLGLKNPEKVIARLSKPLFKPEFNWEKQGVVDNVVFPEGAVQEKDNLNIFYGCADSRIGLAKFNFRNLMDNLAVEVA